MIRNTFFAAILLMLTGAVGYFASSTGSATALIPVGVGGVLFLLGLTALRGPAARKHAMHGAVFVGLIGFVGAAMRLPKSYAAWQACTEGSSCPLAFLCQTSMAAICLIFVLTCIASFVKARLERGY